MSACRPSRLFNVEECDRFTHLFSKLPVGSAYPQHVRHLHVEIDATILWLHCCGLPIVGNKTYDAILEVNPNILSRRSAFHLLTNPFHTWESFRHALALVKANLHAKHSFECLAAEVLEALLRVHTAVCLGECGE